MIIFLNAERRTRNAERETLNAKRGSLMYSAFGVLRLTFCVPLVGLLKAYPK